MNIFSVLKERGFIKQCSGEKELEKLLCNEKIVYYAGFDPTADSLHIGSLVPIMAMAHLQHAGHIPIAIIGGGTTLIGDPSGKTEMRKLISHEQIKKNGIGILNQLKKYLVLNGKNGMFFNNSDWLLDIKYIDFLRDIGKHFKVNEMIKTEAYRQRLERAEGLSFIEFNYQLLQAYDFLVLFERYNCMLQIGGDDQWGNILAGTGLVRILKKQSVYGLTFPLLTTAKGQKMGKTELGTIWLDAKKTTPYEFYQYWINTDDRDVINFLAYFTFLSLNKIHELGKLKGSEIRKAKEVLAFEATRITHGKEEAKKTMETSQSAFQKTHDDLSELPTVIVKKERLILGILVIDLFRESKLSTSKSEARRLIEQGGAYINDEKVMSVDKIIMLKDIKNNTLLRKGKKQYCKIIIK